MPLKPVPAPGDVVVFLAAVLPPPLPPPPHPATETTSSNAISHTSGLKLFLGLFIMFFPKINHRDETLKAVFGDFCLLEM
jgi:hypothetical protein